MSQAAVAREVEGLTDDHADVGARGDLLADRLGSVRADHGHGDDGGAGQEGQARDAGLASVEATVGAACALGVDAEKLTGAQALESGVQRRLGGAAAGTVDGDGADGTHELLGHPARCCSGVSEVDL